LLEQQDEQINEINLKKSALEITRHSKGGERRDGRIFKITKFNIA